MILATLLALIHIHVWLSVWIESISTAFAGNCWTWESEVSLARRRWVVGSFFSSSFHIFLKVSIIWKKIPRYPTKPESFRVGWKPGCCLDNTLGVELLQPSLFFAVCL